MWNQMLTYRTPCDHNCIRVRRLIRPWWRCVRCQGWFNADPSQTILLERSDG